MENFKTTKTETNKPEPETAVEDDLAISYQIDSASDAVSFQAPQVETAAATYLDLVTDDPLLKNAEAVDQITLGDRDASVPAVASENQSVHSPEVFEPDSAVFNNQDQHISEVVSDSGVERSNSRGEATEAAVAQMEEFEATARVAGARETEMAELEQEFKLPSEEFGKVRTPSMVSRIVASLKDKWRSLLHYTGLDIKKYLKTEISEKYHFVRESLKNHERDINPEVIKEAREAATRLFEGRGLFSLTKEEFEKYFTSDEDFTEGPRLKQSNVSDCYLVAAIYALSRSPNFEVICRASMSRRDDGSWEIKIPLLGDQSDVVIITQEEMAAQDNSHFFKKKPDNTSLDLRYKLNALSGNEGFRALEAAYMKHKFGSVNRLAAEWGHGHEALLRLGGDNFIEFSIKSEVKVENAEKISFLGLGSLAEDHLAFLDHYLETFNPETHIATVNTRHDPGKLTFKYRVDGTLIFLISAHAYSLSAVDVQNKQVTVVNPLDTARPINLSFEQFKENFFMLSAVRINNARLLSRITKEGDVL